MEFQCNSWSSIEDLISKIKDFSNTNSSDNTTEIERKWIVKDSIIEFLKTNPNARKVRHLNNLQGYLSIDPEVRYRSAVDIDTSTPYYYIAYKSNGNLVREEYELPISLSTALNFAKYIRNDNTIKEYHKSKFIIKDYWVFEIDNTEFEISIVDNDKKFTYMEIEFNDADSANNYIIPECISKYVEKEVTDDPSYKMKNYWARTRLKK